VVMEATSKIRGHSSHRDGSGKQHYELGRGEHGERKKVGGVKKERERVRGRNNK
jgi:hypothetical protein